MKTKISTLLAAVAIFAQMACAQQSYTPPTYLMDSNGVNITAGVTPWIFDVDSSGQIVGGASKQFAHGDTFIIAPRILDSQNAPRPWPVNTTFIMFYQSGANMTKSNLWYWNQTPATFPVYRTIQQTVSTGSVYWAVSNLYTSFVTNGFLYGTNLVVTNTFFTTNTVLVSTTNSFTNTVKSLATVSIIDTGRVAIAFSWTNDFGSDTYTFMFAAYQTNSLVFSQPLKSTLNFIPSPGLNAAIATSPVNWSNAIMSLVSPAISNATYYSIYWSTNNAIPGYYIMEVVPH